MNKLCVLFAVVFALSAVEGAQNVSITGTLVNNSSGVGYARISLKSHPDIYTYSDGYGEYDLSGEIVSVINRRSGANASSLAATIKNNRVSFTVPASGQAVRMDVFTLSGARIYSTAFTAKQAGIMNVALPEGAHGMRLLRLTVGSESCTMKMHSGFAAAMSAHAPANAAIGSHRIASVSSVDTLVIAAYGFRNALIGIDNYEIEDLVTELDSSNTWRPSAAELVHEKGMVKIMAKGYDFEMGQPDPDILVDEDLNPLYYSEAPVHTVTFTYDFWMDTTEVTQKMYDSVMQSAYPDYVTPTWDDVFGTGDRRAAYKVTWGEAALYCNALSKAEDLDTVYSYTSLTSSPGDEASLVGVTCNLAENGYRLPTEAEWEYACRGGVAADFSWDKYFILYPATAGDTAEVSEHAVWRANAWDLHEGVAGYGVHEVAGTLPNGYGLYDMAGNLSEHVNDYESVSYDYGSVTDPQGPSSGTITMLRGGNWGNDALYLRSASRNFDAAAYDFNFIGFRTVKPVEE